MSMKLRAFLLDNYRAKVEQAYMQQTDVIVLQNVPCEMTFTASAGWMEHENEKHQYLPLFHLTGTIKEIHGNFPYNVSSLSFSQHDVETRLQKEILYYMKPEELAHLITVGKFYSDKFQLPDILTKNEYSFPALVNLTIIPPANPAAYEQATYGGIVDNSIGGVIDATNLPIFYVGFAGTGINRKHDKLLDYYGIDLDEDFEMYALTAESSGYTEPTLIEYITEPVEEEQTESELVDDLYLTPEEEAELLRAQQVEQEVEVPQFNTVDDYEMDAEDMLLAQADKNVERRIEQIMQANKARMLQQDLQAQTQKQAEAESDKEHTVEVEKEDVVQSERTTSKMIIKDASKTPVKSPVTPTVKSNESTLAKLAALQKMIDQSKSLGQQSTEKSASKTVTPLTPVEEVPVKEEPVSEVRSEAVPMTPIKEEKVIGVTVDDTAVNTASDALTDMKPDVPQQMAEVKMDLNPEVNENVHPEMKDDARSEDTDLTEDKDQADLKKAQGADVADARLQAKVDEARTAEAARSVAVDAQQTVAEEGRSESQASGNGSKRREVSGTFEDIAEKADAALAHTEDESTGPKF